MGLQIEIDRRASGHRLAPPVLQVMSYRWSQSADGEDDARRGGECVPVCEAEKREAVANNAVTVARHLRALTAGRFWPLGRLSVLALVEGLEGEAALGLLGSRLGLPGSRLGLPGSRLGLRLLGDGLGLVLLGDGLGLVLLGDGLGLGLVLLGDGLGLVLLGDGLGLGLLTGLGLLAV